MAKQRTKKNYIDYYFVRFGGITAVLFIKTYLFLTHKRNYKVNLARKIKNNEPTIIISNHQRLLDSPAIFSAVSIKQLYQFSPVKFMTWRRIYNSVAKPILYSTGCYSTHGKGKTGVFGAVTYAKQNYRSFIYPEGKRQRNAIRSKAYSGISEILSELPEARIILVYISWTKKKSIFSRASVTVTMTDAPKNIDKTNPDAIMDTIYELK
jgi:1-acyl-sn-glycerol-3-phosphate acyltransferase